MAKRNDLLLILLLAITANATPQSFSVMADSAKVYATWSPNDESDLAGYKVYHGNASRQYGIPLVVKDTLATISGLQHGVKYFFAVTAFDTTGNESGYSQEVSLTIGGSQTNDTTFTADFLDYEKNGAARIIENSITVIALKGQDSWASLDFVSSDTVDIIVSSRGEQALNAWPNMRLAFGAPENAVQNITVTSTMFSPYTFTRKKISGKIYLVFTNDEYIPGVHDRNLYIRSVTIKRPTTTQNKFDVNFDGVVDGLDWIWIRRHIGTNTQGTLWKPHMDFNGDGWIDGVDGAFFARNNKSF